MDRLPYETVCNIFRNTLQEKDPGHGPLHNGCPCRTASVRIPLAISHVSRWWREIALSYGELWSRLHITYRSKDQRRKLKADIEIIDTWLQRSKDSPLDFSIHFLLRTFDEETRNGAKHALIALLSHQRRWKDIDILFVDPAPIGEFPIVSVSDMPFLSSLTFDFEPYLHQGIPMVASVNIMHSRKLKQLSLRGHVTLECEERSISTVTSRSDSSSAGGCSTIISGSQCLDLLKVAPGLRVLEVANRKPGGDDSSSLLDDIVHHGLRTLLLNSGMTSTGVIDHLTLPSLTEFHYKEPHSHDNGENLLRFVQRSLPPLTLLQIDGCRLLHRNVDREASLISILELLPTLQHLRIRYLKVSTRLFYELAAMNSLDDSSVHSYTGKSILCPSLQSLYIIAKGYQVDWIEASIQMVKSRHEILGTFKYASGRHTEDRGYIYRHGNAVDLDDPDLDWRTLVQEGFHGGCIFVLHVYGHELPPCPFTYGTWTCV